MLLLLHPIQISPAFKSQIRILCVFLLYFSAIIWLSFHLVRLQSKRIAKTLPILLCLSFGLLLLLYRESSTELDLQSKNTAHDKTTKARIMEFILWPTGKKRNVPCPLGVLLISSSFYYFTAMAAKIR